MTMDLSGLNKQQKSAVLNCDGPIMILAGAGSGKTRTLVSKISYLLNEKQVAPYQLLALTFSNKAAKEMRHRVGREVNIDIGSLQITTFHAFCARLLRSEAHYLGLSRSFTIYDTSESKSVAKSLLSKRGISTKELSPFEILNYIDELKNLGYYLGGPTEFGDEYVDQNHEYYGYFEEYESELARNNAVDFGGLITGTLNLFQNFPEVLQRYQERFKYILVDEYQDTNRAQFQLLEKLAKPQNNICVVGDEDQSIYSWRGADIRNILDFEEIYPEAKIMKLEQNYRSSKNIIEAASFVIDRNTLRKGKKMWTENPPGDEILIVESVNEKAEAEYISQTVKKLWKEENIPLCEIAVFYRTNAQSRVIEDNLRAQQIPYKIVGGIKFYERKEIKDILAYVRLLVNEKDSLALSRIINLPTRGIGTVTLRKLEVQAIQENLSLYELLREIDQNPGHYSALRLSKKIKSAISEFVYLIEECRHVMDKGEKPSLIYEKLLKESGYWEMLKLSRDYESMARMENLEELSSAFQQYENSIKDASMEGFLETITLDAHNDESRSHEEGEISLMTVHGAKGLEFTHVFVAGVEENLFPSFRSLEEGEKAEEEERRLFYVAMTRAMKKLYISFSQSRMLFGQLRFNGPSRFLHEIPNKYYEWTRLAGTPSSASDNDEFDFVDQEYDEDGATVYQVQSEKKNIIPQKFPKGTKVIHSLYGEGKITDTTGSGPEEKVVIKFSSGEKKKFLVRFAPIVSVN
jgi:DNA helicase-2/ATP-dependent DNA helicase PcrA